MERRVLILAASSTLGLATAERLEKDGDSLWLTYFHEEKRQHLTARFPNSAVEPLNVLELSEIRSLKHRINERWTRLDGLVCAFGIGNLQPIHLTSDKSIAEIFSLDLHAFAIVLRELYPLLTKGIDPAVVLFSSTMGSVGAAGMSLYSAAKSGVATLARSLAIEWAPKRIRVNAVAPGIVPSPLVDSMFSKLTPEQIEVVRQRHPLGFGEPADVAAAVHFLLHPSAKWITGVVLPVDGGYTAQ